MGKSKLFDEERGIHRAKIWEIICFALNDTATNFYMFLFNYITYFLTGIVGVAVVTAGLVITTMRVWDGVTDPFVGFFLDKTNGKFGKNRPFMVIGNIIMCVSSFALFKITPNVAEGARFLLFILIYMIYIIGYTCQCVVTKSGQACLTNDQKQRPVFTMVTSTAGLLAKTILPIVIVSVLVPNAGGEAVAFSNPEFFLSFWKITAVASAICTILAVIGIWRKDRVEYFGTGEVQKIGFKDYWDVIKNNRALQMLIVSASSDKLALHMRTNSVVTVMLFGIVCGNYSMYGTFSKTIAPFLLVLTLLSIYGIARKLGMKRALVIGSWGGIICGALLILLFVLGDPMTLNLKFSEGINFFSLAFIVLHLINEAMGGNGLSAVVVPMCADVADYEVYRSGKYIPGLVGTAFSFIDKLITSLSATFVSLMVAAIGFKDSNPVPTTPLTQGIFWVAIISFFGLPMLGQVCNLIAMKYYPLSAEKMEEIREGINKIKKGESE